MVTWTATEARWEAVDIAKKKKSKQTKKEKSKQQQQQTKRQGWGMAQLVSLDSQHHVKGSHGCVLRNPSAGVNWRGGDGQISETFWPACLAEKFKCQV